MLESAKARIVQERSSRKEPLSDGEARALLKSVSTVVVARGKKSVSMKAADAGPANLKGPTGNYRAPMLVKGKTLLVGFNEQALRDLL